MAGAAVVPPQEPVGLSEPQRLIDTFIAPTKTFTICGEAPHGGRHHHHRDRSVAFVYTIDLKVGFDKVGDNQIQHNPRRRSAWKRCLRISVKKSCSSRSSLPKRSPIVSRRSCSFGMRLWLRCCSPRSSLRQRGSEFQALFALVNYYSLPGLVKSLLAILSLVAGVSSDSFTFKIQWPRTPAIL